jgi:hypothetical protein
VVVELRVSKDDSMITNVRFTNRGKSRPWKQKGRKLNVIALVNIWLVSVPFFERNGQWAEKARSLAKLP